MSKKKKDTPHGSMWAPAKNKPKVNISNRQQDVIVHEMLSILDKDPSLYSYGGGLARHEPNQYGRPALRPLNAVSLATHMGLMADFFIVKYGKKEAAKPPHDVAEAILTLPADKYSFPLLKGIVHTPVVRPDGSLLTSKGYDSTTQLIYEPPKGFKLPRIPRHPSAEQVKTAVDQVKDIVIQFPFADESSLANLIAMFVSPFTRHLAPGPRPLALLEAHTKGSGKTLLMYVWSLIVTGEAPKDLPMPQSNAELRKQITSILLSSPTLVCWDNLNHTLQSGELAKLLTDEIWGDRQLGANKPLEIPVMCDFAITGNNIQLGGDIPRRCYRIRLDAKSATPFLNRTYRYPDLKQHVR